MKLLKTINGFVDQVKPVWMMRQAGRYLPEYRALRTNFSDFIEFCCTPDAVVEATLQPIKRFDFDAAIIFSDILVIPHFLGQNVTFAPNHGPVLEKIENIGCLVSNNLKPEIGVIYEAISKTRNCLSKEKALIGFAGCPWTVATYMLGYKKNNGFDEVVKKAGEINNFHEILSNIGIHIANHCINQLKAGANVIQLFESWAASVPSQMTEKWVFEQAKLIINKIRSEFSNVPIIYFAKGRVKQAVESLKDLQIAFAVDENTNLNDLKEHKNICLQGNLSPIKLAEGDFENDLFEILEFSKNIPFIVNLGHGILPHTPIENVEKFLNIVRGK